MKIYFEEDQYIVEYFGYKHSTGTRSFVDAVAIGLKTFEPQIV